MKLLLDANLSWRMVSVLKLHFDDCLHVDSIGLTVPAKDAEIWDFALENELIIVSNDEDFIDFINVKGFPPKVVLLKTGNHRASCLSLTFLYNAKPTFFCFQILPTLAYWRLLPNN